VAGFRAGWKGLAGERHQEFAQIRCDQLRRRIRSHRRIHAGVRTHRRRAHRLNGYGQQPPWQPRPLSPQERMQMLDQAIFGLASRGGRLLTRTEWNAVVVMGKPVNHVLHLILTLLSLCCCGIWAPVWLLITAFGGEHREILSVDQYGQVSQQRGPMETWRKVLIGVVVYRRDHGGHRTQPSVDFNRLARATSVNRACRRECRAHPSATSTGIFTISHVINAVAYCPWVPH